MDTSHLEYVAEDLIAHRLQQAGLLVAKPKFDIEGTDLLAFAAMADSVKFCRIQCKGRTIRGHSSHIKIPTRYVTKGFLVFLYLEGETYTGNLYCFFASEIQGWRTDSDGNFSLSINQTNYERALERYLFNSERARLIVELIRHAEVTGEFMHLSHCSINATTENPTFSGHCIGDLARGT